MESRLPIRPLVDVTCINAVESMLRRGSVIDPAGQQSALAFADFYVFSVHPRYALPVRAEAQQQRIRVAPLLDRLLELDKDKPVLQVERCVLDYDKRHLNPAFLVDTFQAFAAWARTQPEWLKTWLNVHAEPWIRSDQFYENLCRGYMFNVENLAGSGLDRPLAHELGVTTKDVYYAFDVVLRYPVYGEAAGPQAYYLTHPIREYQQLPTLQATKMQPPWTPASLGEILRPVLPSLTVEQYAQILFETRSLLHDDGVINYETGEVSSSGFDEFKKKIQFSVKLKKPDKTLRALGGVLTMLGAIPVLGIPARLATGAMSIASAFWDGSLPRAAGGIRWLSWAFEWHVRTDRRERD